MTQPVVWATEIQLPIASTQDKRADLDRLKETLKEDFDLSLNTLRQLPYIIRKKQFKIGLVFARTFKTKRLLKVSYEGPLFALAIDLGSTNMVATLWDLSSAQMQQQHSIKNPQLSYGADILSRVQLAMSGSFEQLHKVLLDGINTLIREIAEKAAILPEDILFCSICGNTVMSHFLLGLPVEYIPVEPYIPVAHRFGTFTARELELGLFPEAPVYIFPNAGSYVGGDIIAGILATGIFHSESPQVLLDIGTNGEVVIGCKDWIFVGSGAAGPALEAGVLKAGMAAVEGAIYRIDIKDAKFYFKTIGNKPPVGICGSGVIDLIAELFRVGWIDAYGRFTEKAPCKELKGERVIVVTEATGSMITVSEHEIENFLRSKAGMFTTLYVMATDLGLNFSDIERFYIAGAMGSRVRLDKAKLLGMLPDVPEEKVHAVGNSALKGAEALLLDASLMHKAEALLDLITYKEMNADPRFMSHFRSAMVIPHAEPSVLK